MSLYKRAANDEISAYLRDDSVIVLHGARQVGKTSILYYLRDSLIKDGERICHLDLEDSRYLKILDAGVDQFIRYLAEEGLLGVADQRKLFLYDTGLLQMSWSKACKGRSSAACSRRLCFRSLSRNTQLIRWIDRGTNEEFSFKQV